MRAKLPTRTYFEGREIPGREGYIVVEHIDSGMNAHVFRARSEELNHDIACKIVPRSNLKAEWINEIRKANTLNSREVVRFIDTYEWSDPEHGIDCVALCWQFIVGKSLRIFIKENKADVTVNFIEHFLRVILDLYREMKERRIQHGDIHSGNILVEDQSDSLVGPPHQFRVTDFGVASATGSDAAFKDDFDQLAVVLKELLETVDYQAESAQGKFAFNIINQELLGRHLVEKDLTHNGLARDPRRLFDRLQRISSDYVREREREGSDARLSSPFDYLSCEQIPSDSLLKALYSERFLGLSEIEGKNNLVVTGPRGCGKSTVFKSMSLEHLMSIDAADPDRLDYFGIYYRCSDIYFIFPRYRLPDREEAYDIPVHYVTVSLVREILDTLERWAQKHYPEEFRRHEAAAARSLWELLSPGERPSTPDADTFKFIDARLRRERRRAADKHRFANDPKQKFGRYFGPATLPRICEALCNRLPFLENRPFFFFIDDYSSPKLTESLQQNLNRLFMQRTSCCFFKLSTESPVSYSGRDIDGKIYVEGREFELLNLGMTFIHAERSAKLAFIDDVFRRRLSAIPDYPAQSFEELVGSGSEAESQNEVARSIRDGKPPPVWGREGFCNLCSGDIHFLIRLASQMVANVGGREGLSKSDSIPKIDKWTQNRSIREEAGKFLSNLRNIEQHGNRLVEVVTAFGSVAHSYLKFRDSKNVKGRPPHQASRIEPLEELELSGDAREIYDELLRYSVFIEDMRGKSRRGKVVPRLYLRRFLVPHFKLTFSTRDPLSLEPRAIELLLTDPKEFERSHRVHDPNEGQIDLFPREERQNHEPSEENG